MIHVLLVDDDPSLFNVTKLLLERDGAIRVNLCSSVREALDMLSVRSYHVIISDYDMPGEDGLFFLRRLRSVGDTTPFILFTGRGSEHVAMQACNSGATYYLTKSGNSKDIFHSLRDFVLRAASGVHAPGAIVDKAIPAEKILGSMSHCVLALDMDLRVRYANPQAVRFMHISPDPASPPLFHLLLTEDSRIKFIGTLEGLIGSSRPESSQGQKETALTLTIAGKKESSFDMVINPVSETEGKMTGFVITGRCDAGP